ncbi:hypothetical protein [Pseudomonas abieticivorans]|nr:hypothetical protein [Pseudomonas sp. PIA16]
MTTRPHQQREQPAGTHHAEAGQQRLQGDQHQAEHDHPERGLVNT